MALLSRSSLRGSGRAPDDHDHSDENDGGLAPPLKNSDAPKNPHSRRRRSSPDCLDTTTTLENLDATDPPPPLKPSRPRLSARDRASSSSSTSSSASHTPASSAELADPRVNGHNGIVKHAHTVDLQPGARESPDPLDTILSPNMTLKTVDSSAAAARARHSGDTSVTDVDKTDSVAATRSTRSRKSDPGENLEQSDGGRRSLRSTDTRCKSELAQYISNYEVLIGLEEPQPGKYDCYRTRTAADDRTEFLTATTTITLIDDLDEPLPFPHEPDTMPFGNPLKNLHDCKVIKLPEPKGATDVDPLGEETYFRAHRKVERQEKQLRNIERDRSDHQQQTLERLLEELRSHDWLRVMGLTGVHESEKKAFEPKRDLVIQEVVALVRKFQLWKDEERRRKVAKDKPADADLRSRKQSQPVEDLEGSPVTDTTPDPNDVDALAAQQLHQEARSATVAGKQPKSNPSSGQPTEEVGKGTKHKKFHQTTIPFEPLAPPPDKPFTSFFAKPSQRAAAIAASKATTHKPNRSILAFGRPVPEMGELDFEPPSDVLTEDAIQSAQRKRRRLSRRSGTK
ncbi:hypothetical protein N7474_003778 [Penicillium riverlandense]|uniref:uncharacterized protein n=1 Tax=Penicillium riverlandense TaxID=1903569 RepID=UPI00254785E1|nr:uncharacterized protein N7474_003778 [Penicillium riverlandense]KAJ5818187.1 hypothetical protein N7474_003778 [Penicillium riverlandense]